MPPIVSSLSCTSCGACCGPPGDYLPYWAGQLTVKDVLRLPVSYQNKIVQDDNNALLLPTRITKKNGVQCIALEGTVGQAVACAIYPDRPACCRDYKPGSDRCLEARERAGIDPVRRTVGIRAPKKP